MYFPGGTWIILAVVNTSSLSIGNPHKFNVFLHVVLMCMMSSECHVSAVGCAASEWTFCSGRSDIWEAALRWVKGLFSAKRNRNRHLHRKESGGGVQSSKGSWSSWETGYERSSLDQKRKRLMETSWKLLRGKAYLVGIKLSKDTGGQAKLWRSLISRKCVWIAQG